MKAVLDPYKHLGIALNNINYFRIRLLKKADRSRYDHSPFSDTSSIVWGPKKHNAARGMKDIIEMWLRPLFRSKA